MLTKYVKNLCERFPNEGVRLWQERGVYNLYMQLPEDKVKEIEMAPTASLDNTGPKHLTGAPSSTSGNRRLAGP